MSSRLLKIAAFFLLTLILLLIGVGINSLSLDSEEESPVLAQLLAATLPAATPLSAAMPAMPTMLAPKESWLILPTMPESATQADIGAEIYRLVCRDCHGDKGQGLTDEWRATWNPEHQDCWQSKCHAANHPVNGFDLPRFVPAIIGPSTLLRFREPAELHEYILVKMPWHDPGSLTNEEYW